MRFLRAVRFLGILGPTLALVALLRAAELPAAIPTARIETGEIDGALFMLARPVTWNGHVLLLAHGLRPADAPLSASFGKRDTTFVSLFNEGWIVAMTSYRRNGIIVRDAVADLDALREHIAQTSGPPRLVLLLGESMGGAIVTLMAEREPGQFHGAVAIGAALRVFRAEDGVTSTGKPQIPLLFLTNQSELDEPRDYVAAAADAPVPPVLWTIARDGHVNVNPAERSAALAGLRAWIASGSIAAQHDATVATVPDADSGVQFLEDGAHGRVASITEAHGNVFSTFTPRDFARLGIKRGDDFTLEAGSRTWRVRHGGEFGDVARGEWVAFLRAEGVMLFAINFGNAAEAAGLQEGDPLVIRAGAPR